MSQADRPPDPGGITPHTGDEVFWLTTFSGSSTLALTTKPAVLILQSHWTLHFVLQKHGSHEGIT